MAITFENLIEHNKRTSVLLVASLIVLISILGGVIALAVSGTVAQVDFWPLFRIGAVLGACLAIGGSLFSYFGGNS